MPPAMSPGATPEGVNRETPAGPRPGRTPGATEALDLMTNPGAPADVVEYQGLVIRLLSYAVDDEWRPMAMVETPRGPVVPSVLVARWEPQPTRQEANAYALGAAQAWINMMRDAVRPLPPERGSG